MNNPVTIEETYEDMSVLVSNAVDKGYTAALQEVEDIILNSGYDYDLSMDALVNYAQSSAGYDVSYILAAYSASLQQQNTSEADMLAKLDTVVDDMFPVTYVEKGGGTAFPVTYTIYKAVTMTVVTSQTQTGTINRIPQYRYTTEAKTYYEPDGTVTTTEPATVTTYNPVTVTLPIYSGGSITGTRSAT